MYSISGALVCYNEACYIRYALESLQRVCSEIVVFDSYSTDSTVSICENEYNATVYQHEFDNHRDQKNRAIEKCNNDWILLLDCDEQLSNFLADNIQPLITWAEQNGVDAIELPRFNVLNGEGPRGWPDTQVRLFKKYVRHGGHPFHHSCNINAKKQVYINNRGYILHIKDQSRQEAQNRLYYSLRPQDYKTLPEGVSEEFAAKCKPALDANNPNLYKDFIKNG